MKTVRLLLLLLFIPSSSWAIDVDFITYGGFGEITEAFRRISLLFSDSEFINVFFIFAVMGFFIGYAVMSYGRMLSALDGENAQISLKSLFFVFIGVALYHGTIASKGTVHVYDKQLNKYEAVNNVPDLIVLAAGVTNIAERLISEKIEDSSATVQYPDYAGGLNFKMLQDAVSKTSSFKQFYAIKSLQKFYQECSILPLNTNITNFDIETLKSGTDDIFAYLEELKTPSTFTVYYTATDREGSVIGCDAAYNLLSPIFTTATNYDSYLASVCESNGFDGSDAVQLARCKEVITKAVQTSQNNSSLDYFAYMKNVVVGMAITEAVQNENPDLATSMLTNRSIINEGIGTAIAASNWLPTIKSVVTAIIITLVPILLLFVVTPLANVVLRTMFSLFAWLALWGVCDTFLQQILLDRAYAAMSAIEDHNMGLTAILLTPDASMKSLSILGEARGMAITIASFLAVTLFKLSPYAFSQIGQNFTGQINKHGENSANTAANVEESGRLAEQVVHGAGYIGAMGEVGHHAAMTASMFNQTRGIQSAAKTSNSLSSNPFQAADIASRGDAYGDLARIEEQNTMVDQLGGSISTAAKRTADVSAGTQLGNITTTERNTAPGSTSLDTSALTAGTETGQRIAGAKTTVEAGNHLGLSPEQMKEAEVRENLIDIQGDAAVKHDLRTSAEQNNPTLTNLDIAKNLAEIRTADYMAKVNHNQGMSDLETRQTKERYESQVQEHEGVNQGLGKTGVTRGDAAFAGGQIKGFQGAGSIQAVEVSGEKIASGYAQSLIQTAETGQAIMNYVEKNGGDYEAFHTAIADHTTLMQHEGAQQFFALAERAGVDPAELARSLNGNHSLTLTPDQVEQFNDAGYMTSSQYNQLKESGGQFNLSHIGGEKVTSQSKTGDSSYRDNSTTDNASTSYSGGFHLPHGTDAYSWWTEDSMASSRAGVMGEIIDGNAVYKESLVQRTADLLASPLSSSYAKSDHTTAGMSGSVTGGRKGAGGSGGVDLGVSGTTTETDTYKTDRATVNKMLLAAQDWSENHPSLQSLRDVNASEADIREVQANLFGEKMSDLVSHNFEARKQLADQELGHSEIDALTKETMRENGVAYRHVDGEQLRADAALNPYTRSSR